MKQLLIIILFFATLVVRAQDSSKQKELDSICAQRGHVLWLTKEDSVKYTRYRESRHFYATYIIDEKDSSYLVREYRLNLDYPDFCYRCHRPVYYEPAVHAPVWIKTIWRRSK